MVYNTDFIKRQELLQSQYFFICDCVSCSNKDGPISDKFFCKDCSSEITLQSTICENCSSPVNISKLIDDLNESDIYYKKGRWLVEYDVGMNYKRYYKAARVSAKVIIDSLQCNLVF